MRIAVDTNVLAYAAGLDDAAKTERALAFLRAAYLGHDLVFPAQVLAELFRILVRKAGREASVAGIQVLDWREKGLIVPTSESTLDLAFGLAAAHRLQTFDAVILAASAQAGCRLLLSEDLQDGFSWGGVTVVDPFAAAPHPLLLSML